MLLDSDSLLGRELAEARKELHKLEARVSAAIETSKFVRNAIKQKRDFSLVVREIEKLHPYELNSQKPLTELIGSIPEDMRQWELDVGNRMRVEHVWIPAQILLSAYVTALEQVKHSSGK